MKHRTAVLATAALLLAAGPALTGCASGGTVQSTGSATGGSSDPGPAPTAPGQYRVLPPAGYGAPCSGNCSLPPVPRVFVRDAAGNQVGLVIDPAARSDHPQRMELRVCPYRKVGQGWAFDIGACKDHLVAGGDGVSEAGLAIEVLHLWWSPDGKTDALDVAVTAA